MKLRILLFLGIFCIQNYFHSQNKEMKIDTVFLFDSQINKQQNFHLLKQFSREEILKNSSNLSELLRFQTPIYIKENGRGAVSSPSFRGTTAQQTAFLWNGISINSTFLGQGDINNIGFLLTDNIIVKSGGGSVLYGSGAIGGSIHLDNSLSFDKGFSTQILSEIASYQSFTNVLKSKFSNDKFSVQLSANQSISKNDYEVIEKKYKNINGQYNNGSLNIALAYKINQEHQISWISEYYSGNQHFPIFEESQNRANYKTLNSKTLGIWSWDKERFSNRFRIAFLEDEFRYYQKENGLQSSGGNAQNLILKDELNYKILNNLSLNFLSEFQKNKAVGYLSGIDRVSRLVFSNAMLLKYNPTPTINLELGAKKESVQRIYSPWLFSFAGNWKVLKNFQTAFSFSKNFRYPSFNDLYFQPGGNIDLLPETSLQYEWKNQWRNKNISFIITPYFMNIKDMIRWLPTSDGYWKAFNTNQVYSYGIESQLVFRKKWGNHLLNSSLGYAFTKSINQATLMQLSYVPLHKANVGIDYQYKNAKIYIQGLVNGKTYTDTMQNELDALQPYFILNVGVSWLGWKNIEIGGKINNLTDQIYATTAYYYMPKRNYSMSLKIKI
ncbi:MAG: TonB-dependent receptor [Bacteroidetes bacterium]|nr:TonB-dependent receptor [Bacteroidota bacterium]